MQNDQSKNGQPVGVGSMGGSADSEYYKQLDAIRAEAAECIAMTHGGRCPDGSMIMALCARVYLAREAISEYVNASRVNVPADRVQRAWQTLCNIADRPNVRGRSPKVVSSASG